MINTSDSDAGLQLALETVVTDGEVIEASVYTEMRMYFMVPDATDDPNITVIASTLNEVALNGMVVSA